MATMKDMSMNFAKHEKFKGVDLKRKSVLMLTTLKIDNRAHFLFLKIRNTTKLANKTLSNYTEGHKLCRHHHL